MQLPISVSEDGGRAKPAAKAWNSMTSQKLKLESHWRASGAQNEGIKMLSTFYIAGHENEKVKIPENGLRALAERRV